MPGIQEFYQTAATRGFARKNLFRITRINDGTEDVYAPQSDSDNLFLYLKDAMIPARNISYTVIDYKAFKLNVPTVANYPESGGGWSAQFLCDDEYTLRNLFEKWSVTTFDEHTNTSSSKWWNSSVEMVVLKNATGKDAQLSAERFAKKIILRGVFPTNVGTISYDVTDNGNVATMGINLSYQYIISER